MAGRKSKSGALSPAERHQKLIDKMNEPLRKKYEEAASLLTKDAADATQVRYRLGGIAGEIKDANTYGDKAVERFSRALGLNKATVYGFAAVAEAWDKKAIGDLLKRQNILGAPLSFSHLILLAQVKRATKRDSLIDSALKQGWPVSKLRRQIEPEKQANKRSSKLGISAGLRALVSRSESLLTTIDKSETAVFSVIDKSAADKVDEKTIKLLEDAKVNNQKLLEACTANVKKLDEALEKAKQAVADKVAEGQPGKDKKEEAA